MNSIVVNLMQVRQRIELAALAAKREPEEIELLAVSKTFPASAIEEAMHAGQSAFGENYVQEGVEKIIQLEKLRPWLVWHFIGPLQSNKTREVAEHFDWVHSVDRLKIAERLSAQRGEFPHLAELQVCVQVNVSEEDSKSGVPLADAQALCDAISKLPNVILRGLMAIPAPNPDPKIQREAFAAVRACFQSIQASHLVDPGYQFFDTLSMGMSDDLEAAIAEGSTMVRIGTAIFGKRDKISK
ncbi:YggS family pyridoxal phosphate-dependent enzyme [Polynucleobacter sp. JS-JIR-5-A7]|mgnify:FL=1|jgi:pyridoxal phosphate enzyme (YggS family)|uniref:YggS family pyridoxal phosphate-dependent enzyme n=1 Tax=Polynucleobacter sp. JS-JIR-5-A7 TaxID=1758395 RepID=UPI001BFCEDA0|nr:YggS family pyridoxal phosphate-dependent enzyme [Polynucleobacter sp. JS-JIR-5-A7]QWE06340.1 YggS family pyridoxal phosphate-dependent enzyme [Polynucleobacter sp. JS-JIR-5-A7]